VLERLSYEAYGERRNANGTPQNRVSPIFGVTTDRGYTGHEHLDELNLIHMNGRIYDPALGRFMTADPVLQSADNLQSYNRYSYVLNNPLMYTDPSGYRSLRKTLRQVAKIAAIATVAVFAPEILAANFSWAGAAWGASEFGAAGYTLTTAGSIASGAIGGFAAGLINSGGNIEAGLHGALTGALFGAASTIGGPEDLARYAAHGAAGCISGEVNGGGCGNGAISAVAGKFATNLTQGNPVAAIVAGGTVSVLGGGKFANGAYTAAFGYLFNQLSCRTDKCVAGPNTTRKDLDDHYRGGTGLPVEFDGSKINLDYIRPEDLNQLPGTRAGLTVNWATAIFSSNPQAQMFGSMTGVFESREAVRLYDRYEFESHGLKGWLSDPLREVFTSAGSMRAGSGVPFDIHFMGATPIPQR